jgi:hypothetical protein
MALQFIGAAAALAGSVTLPAHQAGDMIIVCAFKTDGDGNPPGLASGAGYTSLADGGADVDKWRVGYKIAASSSEVSGGWANATGVIAHVYRGTDVAPGNYQGNGGDPINGIKYGFPSGADLDTINSRSWVVAFAVSRQINNPMQDPPTGMLNRTNVLQAGLDELASHDTNGGVNDYVGNTVTGSGSSTVYRTVIVEIPEEVKTGAGSFTESNVTLSSTGIRGIDGSAAITLGNDTIDVFALKSIGADLAKTLGNDTFSISGEIGWGTVAYTEGNVTSTSFGAHQIDATLAATLGNDTFSITGDLGGMGNLAATIGNDTVSATGDLETIGQLSQTLGNDAFSIAGDLGGYGNLSVTLANDAFTTFGAQEITAAVAQTLGNDAFATSALHGIEASGSFTEGAVTLSSTGSRGIDATLAATLADDTFAIDGSEGLYGELAVTLADDAFTISAEKQRAGVLSVTLVDDVFLAEGELEGIGQLSATLVDDVFSISGDGEPWGIVTATLGDDTIVTEGGFYIFATLNVTLGDDYLTYRDNAIKCCSLSLCNISLSTLVCNFVNLLPSGPLWDASKRKVIDHYVSYANDEEPPPVEEPCTSLVSYSVYTAFRLHDLLQNALFPAIRESNPNTAYDTLDEWLDRYRWIDCFYGSCRDPDLGPLTPFEFPTDCGPIFCPVDVPTELQTTVKHGLVVALSRLRLGLIPNIKQINWIIAPLGAYIQYRPTLEPCPLEFLLSPTSDTLPTWQRITCSMEEPEDIQAWFDPNDCFNRGLPNRIWPGVMAAECIVRSLLRHRGVKITRVCQ